MFDHNKSTLQSPTSPSRLLVEWNNTYTNFPQNQCLHRLFEAQAEQTPQATAVIFENKHLTYQQLNRQANQLAHYLQTRGVGPNVLVGICIDRSLELVVGLLGILKAGGAYIPLDPTYPPERLAFMLQDSQAPLLLTQQSVAHNLPEYKGQTIYLDTGWDVIAGERTTKPDCWVETENLAYVIYTSGSTGRPKGVMISHRAICNHLHWMQMAFPLTPADAVLQKTPISFDPSIWELFGPLLAGAQLIVARPNGHKEPAYLISMINTHSITHLRVVPSLLRLLLQETAFESCTGLKRVFSGGEVLPPQLVQQFNAQLSAELHNLYGPTEAAIVATWWTCSPESRQLSSIPIGRPIANMQAYILDEQLTPVPVGVTGELHLAGVGLARGYLNRPDLTAEKFIPNPFAKDEDETTSDGPHPKNDGHSSLITYHSSLLYKTGDLARYLPDGSIEFGGRLDHQVKIRGFRIELGEIEAVLRQHPGVTQAVVAVRPNAFGDAQLTAYLVPHNLPPTTTDLRRFLQTKLPDYMIPATFITLEALPLTPNGKIDRLALPAPSQNRPALETAYVAPSTQLEQLLAEMWQNVLGLEPIGIDDNFFELGGDSIKGAIFINTLQEQLQEMVHVVALFDAPTISKLADYLRQHYPQATARMLGDPTEAKINTSPTEKITADQVIQLRALIPASPLPASPQDKNPPAVFILSPPRSGSTLLRVMLAGHPKLFAPPELKLLPFNTLAERKVAFSGPDSSLLEGAVRAIMQAKNCSAEQAQKLMQQYEAQQLPTGQFYDLLQRWVADKTVVEKSTTYALDIDTLHRAEALFERPLYIHLMRHPYGMIHSFEKIRLDQIFFRYEHPFSRRQLAELVWLVYHQNILEFLKQIPTQRHHFVKYEDLVTQPQQTTEALCQFLGLDFHPDMLEPYKDGQQRMTDGLHAVSRMIGDPKFHQHRRISPNVAEAWRKEYTTDFLGNPTRQMAQSFGYRLINPGPESINRIERDNTAQLLAQLDHLSNDEIDALLNEMLPTEQ